MGKTLNLPQPVEKRPGWISGEMSIGVAVA